jgi:hypothetical protein
MSREYIFIIAISLAIPILWVLYERFTYREAKVDELDRVVIKPGLMSWIFSAFSFALFSLFITQTINAVVVKEDLVFWLSLGPPLSLLMGFGTYISAITRLRANGAYVERRGVKGWRKFEWDDVDGLYHHSILGHRLHLNERFPIPVWIYGSGWKEMRELFEMYEKPFQYA